MLRVRLLLFLFLLLAVSSSFAGKDKEKPEGWLPVTQQDWDTKTVPNDPGAGAVQLYFAYYKDDDAKFVRAYHRIKILNEAGKDQADIKIELNPDESLKDLAARTIHPDGSIVEFAGKPFEKLLAKSRGVKYVVKTFTLPEITVGSIIEYRYVLGLPAGIVSSISRWPIQQSLFTIKENLRFRAFQGLVEVPTEWSNLVQKSQVSYSYLNQTDLTLPQKKEGNLMEMELQNVPRFDAEEYMPPADDYRPVVLFYYGGREMASPEKYWDQWQHSITDYIDKFIGNSREVHDAAAQAIGGETDPEKKLRKLYARAQQIRNLSAERERTKTEQKEERLKRNMSAQEVLQHGYGTAWDIDAIFVAMARAAGFEANMLGVSDRDERSFNKLVLWLGQIDSRAALVALNGKSLVLDPGTRFCQFGLLRWKNSGVTALKFSKTGDTFITTPPPESSLLHRKAQVALTTDGALTGELVVDFQGEDALEHRIEALAQDEAGRRKSLEDEVQTWLPRGAVVKLQDSQGWDSTSEPLHATFKIDVPDFASSAGKRIVSPAFFLPTLQKNMFTSGWRKYPITFPYPFVEDDEVSIKLPDGYDLEEPPYHRKAGLSYAGYEISTDFEEHQLITKRKLHFDDLQLPPERYEEVKNFFSIVQKGDGGQAVLHVAETEKAEKAQSPN
jgi:hypothetical protein